MASMDNRSVCRFFNTPSGCRRGDSCGFRHTTGPPSPSRGNPGRGRGGFTPRPSRAPRGICDFYFDRGFCTRGSDCNFLHERPSDAVARATPNGSSALEDVAALLKPAALARIQGAGTDGFFGTPIGQMKPSDVEYHIRRFLDDSYRFRFAADVYGFLALVSNASSGNEHWSPEDGQDNGLLRIGDILSWSDVSVCPTSRTCLSFGRGYIPLLKYLSSDWVVKSITSRIVNALYSVIMEHFDQLSETITSCMKDALEVRKSFKEPHQTQLMGSAILSSIVQVLFEYVTRFKNATATHPSLYDLVINIQQWTTAWIEGITAEPPTFDDSIAGAPPQARHFVVERLCGLVDRLTTIVERKHRDNTRVKEQKRNPLAYSSDEGILAALHNAYEGPGTARPEGPRHDNDFIEIGSIQIAPTHDELTSRLHPFLPANIYGAPHPLDPESMEQLLDIQFRLLREELTASLRASAQAILSDLDLQAQGKRAQLDELQKKGGGKYRGHAVGQDTIMFNVYTNVDFHTIAPSYRGLVVGIGMDTPPGRARNAQAATRARFWESMSSKRLMQGGLVALVWQQPGRQTEVHLGTVASSLKDLKESASHSADRVNIRVSFFSPEVELRILQDLRLQADKQSTKLLIEATVMFESVRPFLEALRAEPETIPFSKYLVHHPPEFYQNVQVSPPAYTSVPEHCFQLSSLFDPATGIDDLRLVASSPESIENARETLRNSSVLDPSQADAMIDSLTREISLIQGPPGTGKSFTGVKLLRVLIANKAGPILLIAFTNHALDHMLSSVLNEDITNNIVRLGSRSSDERISKFSLEEVERVAGRSRFSGSVARYRHELRNVEEEIKKFMDEFFKREVDPQTILNHIRFQAPILHESIESPTGWTEVVYKLFSESEAGWRVTGAGGKDGGEVDRSVYGFWLQGGDITFLNDAHYTLRHRQPAQQSKAGAQAPSNRFDVLQDESVPDADDEVEAEDIPPSPNDSNAAAAEAAPEEEWLFEMFDDTPETAPDVAEQPFQPPNEAEPPQPHPFFVAYGCPDVPPVPTTTRQIEVLRDQEDAWSLSADERLRLHEAWSNEVRLSAREMQTAEFRRLREKHAAAAQAYSEGQAEVRKQLLRNVDIIGCTTTGACRDFNSQCQIDFSLIGIGPKIVLVEEAGQVLEAHVLGSLVPSIQHLILIGDPLQLRPTLNNYSLSMDHSHGKLVYKFDMSLMERLSSSGLHMSQINVQRRMRPEISDLVRMTLYPRLQDHEVVKNYPNVQGMTKNVFFMTHNHKENGGEDDSVSKYNQYEVRKLCCSDRPYSEEGDIVVLCAYLGQLSRLREALSNEVAVVLDERDKADLDDREAETEDAGTSFELVKVSRRVLLRTIDNFQGEEAKIIILSLVRNAGGSEEDKTARGRVNIGFLRSANRANVALSRAREGMYILGNASNLSSRSDMWHTIIDELRQRDCLGEAFPVPGQLPRIAPDGGCLQKCDTKLKCGHLCPYKCHSDDPRHVTISCAQRCTRLCPRGHPCLKQCADDCGECRTTITNVELPCGHVAAQVACFQLDNLDTVHCRERVTKTLPTCEHEVEMGCSEDPRQHYCRAPCSGIMGCCGRTCSASCFQCQSLNQPAPVENAAEDAQNAPVTVEAIKRVEHSEHPCQRSLFCGHLCGKPCSTNHECTTDCKERCRQECAHARCKDYCSSPYCATISPNMIVCGEDCSLQICPQCATEDRRADIVDLVMQTTLGDIDFESENTDELLITLPGCGHVFTYYRRDNQGKWIGLQAPPEGFKQPPACPTCRTAITAPRYGRIVKRADLDILENNSLKAVHAKLAAVSKDALAAQADAKPSKLSTKEFKALQLEQTALLRKVRATPLSLQEIDPLNAKLHGLPVEEARAWKKLDAASSTKLRPAHTHAWEASYTYLYQKEMDEIAANPTTAPRNPNEYAMRVARLKVGQPPPRADKRFLVETFWLATAWLETEYPPNNRRMWASYALDITRASESHRQEASTLEQFRFNVQMTKHAAKAITIEARTKLADNAGKKQAAAREEIAGVRARAAAGWRGGAADFMLPAEAIVDDWKALERSLRLDTFYQPVSHQELTEVVKGLGREFSSDMIIAAHTGHFYKCPNGHIFVIGDCGGATVVSHCNECGERIGGTGHTLLGTNTQAHELENIARQEGYAQSPWQWAQGA
ncbi:P-loop containing nucleoside triphosphate hydrolase protein [Epithele typhae]|uniref:P-loop containing nucleoside triphosphate hydrolase protein n=1 Tax=Epithele typhae TaxID=378194 RepID=UPI002008C819|nr:P-loop containing nucleoside triphosphate hydrolase protein [Epithele typhae]KAH9931167.1 P-loop containing nucleoside triphosphate hydrolase protein [Epithele typhae]